MSEKIVNDTNDLFDPYCDPSNPKIVFFQDVSGASFRLRNGLVKTACTKAHQLSQKLGMDLYFKKDFLQVTGSFKERGARNVMLQMPEDQKAKGVVAASAGNHALALAYHGNQVGVPVTVVMPVIAPIMKVSNCRNLGANVIIKGEDLSASKEMAMKIAKEKGMLYVNGYDHPEVIAGQGTMGMEIMDQVEKVDAILVPVGGGSLLAGLSVVVKYLSPATLVIGVEAERCASFAKAMQEGKPTFVKPGSSAADGLSVPLVGVNAFETAKDLVDKMVAVSEQFIALAILRLVESEKAIVEGAGAVCLGALLQGLLPELAGKRVVIALTGGNIDTASLGRCIDRGLACDRRLVRFSVIVSDRPGGLGGLIKLIESCGAAVKNIRQDRAWVKADLFSVHVKLVVETRDGEHADEIEKALKESYDEVTC